MDLADLDCWAIEWRECPIRVWCIASPQQPQTIITSDDAAREGLSDERPLLPNLAWVSLICKVIRGSR